MSSTRLLTTSYGDADGHETRLPAIGGGHHGLKSKILLPRCFRMIISCLHVLLASILLLPAIGEEGCVPDVNGQDLTHRSLWPSRLHAFIGPWDETRDSSHHPWQILMIVSSTAQSEKADLGLNGSARGNNLQGSPNSHSCLSFSCLTPPHLISYSPLHHLAYVTRI